MRRLGPDQIPVSTGRKILLDAVVGPYIDSAIANLLAGAPARTVSDRVSIDSCRLTRPTSTLRDTFLLGAREFAAEGRLDSTYAVCLGYDLEALEQEFDAFVRDLDTMGATSNRPNNCYVDQIFWLLHHEEYVGQLSFRPELSTPYLITYGGHVGYSIRPSQRRRGLGKEILRLGLQEARRAGLKRTLITCDSDNIPSRRIIEHNGGCFESSMKIDGNSRRSEGVRVDKEAMKLRYWIELNAEEKIR